MKRIRYFVVIFFISAAQSLFAQDTTLSLSLHKAREMAIANSLEIFSKETDVRIAEDNVALEKIKRYPTVFGDLNLQRNLIIPVTPVPAKAFDPTAPADEIRPLQFATKWSGNTGLNASYDLFNPNLKSEINIKKMQAKMAETDREMAENEAYFSVSNAYVAALIAQKQLALNTAEVASKSKTLRMFQEQFDAGRMTVIQLNEGKSDLNSAKARVAEAQSIADKANAQLLYELGYPPEDTIAIAFEDSIEDLFINGHHIDKNESQSITLKKIEQQGALLAYQWDRERFRNYPTITLGGYYGTSYFANNFDIFKDRNFHGNSYIKAGIKVPITDWFSQKKNRSIIARQYQANELSLQSQQNKIALGYVQALKDAEAAHEKYLSLKENFDLAHETMQLTEQQFQEGRVLVNEIYKADFALQKAKNDYLNAAYDYITAELKLENELKK